MTRVRAGLASLPRYLDKAGVSLAGGNFHVLPTDALPEGVSALCPTTGRTYPGIVEAAGQVDGIVYFDETTLHRLDVFESDWSG